MTVARATLLTTFAFLLALAGKISVVSLTVSDEVTGVERLLPVLHEPKGRFTSLFPIAIRHRTGQLSRQSEHSLIPKPKI